MHKDTEQLCIKDLYGEKEAFDRVDVTIRNELRPGDLGWVLHQHGIRYAAEQQYDYSFEKEIAESIVRFVNLYQQDKASMWVAEHSGHIAGTVAVHSGDDDEADIRWIMVLPEYRGLGIGSRLMTHALDYCRSKDIKTVHCRNVSEHSPGIPLYLKSGFTLVSEECVKKWGHCWLNRHYVLYL